MLGKLIGILATVSLILLGSAVLLQKIALSQYKEELSAMSQQIDEVRKYADTLSESLKVWADERRELTALQARQKENISRELQNNEAFNMWADGAIPVDDLRGMLGKARDDNQDRISPGSIATDR